MTDDGDWGWLWRGATVSVHHDGGWYWTVTVAPRNGGVRTRTVIGTRKRAERVARRLVVADSR